MTFILGLETSCDETAAAVVQDGRQVLSNVIASQHALHQRYGGVVPEIASRAHLERLLPVVDESLAQAGVTAHQIDAVAVGNRPGLIGSLLVGVSAAKAAAWALDRPLVGVNHVQAHLYAASLVLPNTAHVRQTPDYPALGLVVSGGHSNLYAVDSPTQLTLLGKTIDDAVGEAYDKAAVILRAGYPGGPKLDKLAQSPGADPARFQLPRSMLDKESLDFSFSGLKTALLYEVRGHPVGRGDKAAFARSADDLSDKDRIDLAASFQHAAVETLIAKLQRALDGLARAGQTPRSLVIGGGVCTNSLLRARAVELGHNLGLPVYLPAMSLCVDNAAMIAGLAFHHFTQRRFDRLDLPAIATTG